MRGFTIAAAIVVGLTWALTVVVSKADPQPNRLHNPFRKSPKRADSTVTPTPRPFDMYEGNPINAHRFSRVLDDELATTKNKGNGARGFNKYDRRASESKLKTVVKSIV